MDLLLPCLSRSGNCGSRNSLGRISDVCRNRNNVFCSFVSRPVYLRKEEAEEENAKADFLLSSFLPLSSCNALYPSSQAAGKASGAMAPEGKGRYDHFNTGDVFWLVMLS